MYFKLLNFTYTTLIYFIYIFILFYLSYILNSKNIFISFSLNWFSQQLSKPVPG